MEKSNAAEKTPLVEAVGLKKYFKISRKKLLHAVDDVNFRVFPGETLGLVGESGCGKSTVGNVVMRLHEPTAGKVLYEGRNIFDLTGDEAAKIRQRMQIVFQDPYSSLNPRKTIRKILSEPFEIHAKEYTGQSKLKLVKDLCDTVEIPHNLLELYPHELDGGMRQVVGIARALSLKPKFIVCDEPVSSLDVSVQARIINLLIDLQKRDNYSYLFISHDLSVVRHISNRIAVMYLGQIIETAETDELFKNTMHPYSIALLSAVPRVDVDRQVNRIVLKGDVPSPINPPKGCRFAPRCWMAKEECLKGQVDTTLEEVSPGHFVACPFAREAMQKAEKAARNKKAIENARNI